MDMFSFLTAIVALIVVFVSLTGIVLQKIRKTDDAKWKKRLKIAAIVFLVAVIVFFVSISNSPCNHEWAEATCTEPKTCMKCGETEGEALGHDWIEATCSAPKTCSRCDETEGEMLEHTPGEWKLDEPDYVTACVWARQFCEVCGKEINSELKGLKSLYEGDTFLFSAEEFTKRINSVFGLMDGCGYTAKLVTLNDSDDTMGCLIYDGNTSIADILFFSNSDVIGGKEKDTQRVIAGIAVCYNTSDESIMAPIMVATIVTCDAQMDTISDAAAVAKSIIVYSYMNNIYEENGIQYLFGNDGNGNRLYASLYKAQ